MRYLLTLLVLLSACHAKKSVKAGEEKDQIVFLILNISREKDQARSTLELKSKTVAEGSLKGNDSYYIMGSNYLLVQIYKQNVLVDSMVMEHPLYKHYEYIDSSNQFAVKDTVLTQAEFSVRVHVKGSGNEVHITEVMSTTRNALTPIKL